MTVVGDVMTPNPIVAQVPGSRTEVLRTMVKHNLTGLPVVKRADGSLAGIITRQDIFNKPDEDQLALLRGRKIGFVFQSYNLVPTLTAEENVMLPVELRGQSDGAASAIDGIGSSSIAVTTSWLPSSGCSGWRPQIMRCSRMPHAQISVR